MRKRYSAAGITQEVILGKSDTGEYRTMELSSGDGYQKTLQMDYMKELAVYLREDGERSFTRLILVSGSEYEARQAFLSVLKYKMAKAEKDKRGGYDYTGVLGARLETIGPVPEVCLLKHKKEKRDDEAVPAMMLHLADREESRHQKPLKAWDYLMVEVDGMGDADEEAENLLTLQNRHIAIAMKPVASYKYIIKRLVFEGGYHLVTIPKIGRGEYLEYAQEYLNYHGFSAKREHLDEMLSDLMAYRGNLMTQESMFEHLSRCMKKAEESGNQTVTEENLKVAYDGRDALVSEEFDRMIGLREVKDILLRRLYARKLMQDKPDLLHSNYIAEGAPGTGKSKMARLLAGLMAQMGISNGRFVDATRSDLIGKYVGHTANMVREVFERAEGGVLFIDEASFLTQDDRFVKEAVVELVRYMELYPQTTVIFATYEKAGEELLDCDPGFASRISRILKFPSYSDEELYQIFETMAEEYGFCVEEGCREAVMCYTAAIRDREDFGNAREVRKLLEAAIEECGMRNKGNAIFILQKKDVEMAADYLGRRKTKAVIGFS